MSALKSLFLAVVTVSLLCSTALAENDPPARVARLNYISGQVSIQPVGENDWVAGAINRPLTSQDKVWADKDGRAELQLGSAALRLNSETSLTLVNVADNAVQVQLDQGTMNVHVTRLFDGEIYEIDTPNVAFTVQKSGDYRIDVDNAGDTTVVTTFKGEGDATGDGPAVRVRKNEQVTFSGGRSLRHVATNSPGFDGFDDWCRVRSERQDKSASLQYVSPYAVGYPDLDEYGRWETASQYGPVWYPSRVALGWAPYRFGHWVWINPWGWTWVDDAPWGFTPFHYGRWVSYGGRWGWCPGPFRVRPIYAPALVAWVGGPRFGAGLSFGIGGGVGWFPLGWGEPYVPYYRHSRGYFENVNISNTHINNITVITNNYYGRHDVNFHYANRTIPNAVTAVSNQTFTNSRPTRDGFVRVSEHDMANASVQHEVHPTRESRLGANAGEQHAVPPQVFSHPARGGVTGVAGVEANRPDRTAGYGNREAIHEPQGAVVTNSEAGRPSRVVPRPPDRGASVNVADEHTPRGAATTVDRVPRPTRNVTPAPGSSPNTNVGPVHTDRALRVDHSVPRPAEGAVIKPAPKVDNPGREMRQGPVNAVPQANRNEGVTHDARPSRQAEPAKQAGPAHENKATRPARQSSEKEGGGPHAGLRYPSLYSGASGVSSARSSYAPVARSYAASSYRANPSHASSFHATSVRTPSASYSQRSYVSHASQPAHSTQSASRSVSHSSGGGSSAHHGR